MGNIIMGYWDCTFCDRKHIAGSERECPSCGHPRPDNTRFYMDGTKPVNENTAKIVRARGKDWACPTCDCLNSGLDDICASCGSPRDGEKDPRSKRVPESNIKDITARIGNEFRATESSLNEQESFETPVAVRFGRINKRINKQKLLLTIGTVLAGIALIVGLIILFTPKPVTIKIADMGWEYNIDIEKLTPVDESDWYLPPGARLRYTREEIHHYEPVFDHYEPVQIQVPDGYDEIVVGHRDLGNGYFEEITTKQPRYKTETSQKEIYRDEPQYQTKSALDKNPKWGDVVLHDKEREGSRTETYTIYGKDSDDKSRNMTVDRNTWGDCDIGDTISGKVDIFGHFTLNAKTGDE